MSDPQRSRSENSLDHSLEAEQAVLGALLVDETAIDAIDGIDPEWMYFASHQEIARGVLDLISEKKPHDSVTVFQRLEAKGKIPEPVPRDLVWSLSKGLGTASNIRHYLDIVRNAWAFRKAKLFANGFVTGTAALDAQTAIATLQRDLTTIETGKGSRIISAGETMVEMYQRLEEESEAKPGTEIVSTGFAAVDEIVGGFEPGILHMYAARPGVGKSGLALAFAHALGAAGIPTAVFWWEDTARKFALRLAASVGEIPSLQLRHGKNMRAPNWERLCWACDTVSKWPIFVEPAKGLTAIQVAHRMRRLKREKGVRVFIADHLGELRLQETDRRDMALGDAAGIYRDEAEELGACPVLFHQLGQKAETEKGAPRLGWLFNSDVLGQKARVVGFISRDGCTIEIDFVKATYGPPHSKAVLGWNADTMTIFEPHGDPQRSLPT